MGVLELSLDVLVVLDVAVVVVEEAKEKLADFCLEQIGINSSSRY